MAVKQQHSSDITYGRVESTPNYKIHHAVTSEKPRNDIVIEEASSDDRETFKDDGEERMSDFKETADRHTSTKKVSLILVICKI